jgi:lipopolysaccharide biosynthesis protein
MARFIAFYLPQFHPIPENDEWWGKGFTEWTNVGKAKPLFKGHYQPRVPADLGYYDLRMSEVREAQAEMAREAGIEGFCYWHYWFGNGKRLLERPFNEVLKSGKPDFPFCLGWANHSWGKNLWDKDGTSEILIEQTYLGEEDHINHFNSLLEAFRDNRYIKVNNKPLFIIYNPTDVTELSCFIKIWRGLAAKSGLNDFYFVAHDSDVRSIAKYLNIGFDAVYDDNTFNIHHQLNIVKKVLLYIQRNWLNYPTIFEYKDAIKYMITENSKERNVIPVIAPNWDHSPRSGSKSILLHNSHPKYFKQLIFNAINAVKDKPEEEQIVFIKAWNEWGEGNYMEPDLKYGMGYIEVMRDVLDKRNYTKK